MDQQPLQILNVLHQQNTEMRMQLLLLDLELKAEQQRAKEWQQVAMAAIAKADLLEQQLLAFRKLS
jgi:hypothetical protein